MSERFTAPVSGRYHFGSGTPHHEAECDETCPMHASHASKELAVRDETAPAVRVVDIDIADFTAAVTQAWRAIRETLEPVFRAVIDAFRPLVALLEEYPELADLEPEPAPENCHHLCGSNPGHECTGDATDMFAYRPGGREIPMCEPCREAVLAQRRERGADDAMRYLADAQARGLSTGTLTLAHDAGPTIHPQQRNWPEQGSTCAHVCGPDPDHACLARATEYLTYPLPSGGTRRMPLCTPCHASETAEAQAALPTVAEASANLNAVAGLASGRGDADA